ncbi:MAG: ATPase [Chloroflexota bacterium]|nr:ATPase [Chloroflexota bacterium]
MTRESAAMLAVDGGNSKTDVALVARDGALLALVSGPSVSHQEVGLETGIRRLAEMAADALQRAGVERRPAIGVYCLAGADLPRDLRMVSGALEAAGLADVTLVRNDAFAILRAGAPRGRGVAVICGAGVNCVAVAPDGRTARLAGLGDISGDWGGGQSIGTDALGAAVRARDGRGPRTALERLVPAHFSLRRPLDVTNGLYTGAIAQRRILELAPLVFQAAADGDSVARSIVDRMADEITAMAAAMLRRLHLTRSDADVVLGGGIFRTREPDFYARIERGVVSAAPRARVHRLTARPVLGAALLGLDRLNAGARAEWRLREAFASS